MFLLDVQSIIDNSDIGIFYKKNQNYPRQNKIYIIKKEKTIKETEIDIESKNILNKDGSIKV